MLRFHSLPALLFALSALLAGCQSITSNVEEWMPSAGKHIEGEVRWDMASRAGDVMQVALQDGAGVLDYDELQLAPGTRNTAFSLSVTDSMHKRCVSSGSCHYVARLMRGELAIQSGDIYYTPTTTPTIMMGNAMPSAAQTGQMGLPTKPTPDIRGGSSDTPLIGRDPTALPQPGNG